jgi:hypothetical protein
MFFIGMVLAMQSAVTLKSFGYVSAVGGLVAASVLREIGPMLTAIVLAGRSGAAITAELGTMRVSEEIDALETMGLNPVQFLIVPRVLGMVIMAPCLTILGDFVAMFGGYLIAFTASTLIRALLAQILRGADDERYCLRMLKSVVFAGLVSNVAAILALFVDGGAEGGQKHHAIGGHFHRVDHCRAIVSSRRCSIFLSHDAPRLQTSDEPQPKSGPIGSDDIIVVEDIVKIYKAVVCSMASASGFGAAISSSSWAAAVAARALRCASSSVCNVRTRAASGSKAVRSRACPRRSSTLCAGGLACCSKAAPCSTP